MTLDELQDIIRETNLRELPEHKLFSSTEFAAHLLVTMSNTPEPFRTTILFALGYEAGLVMGKRKAEIESLNNLLEKN